MGVIRVKRNGNFTTICNISLRDTRLSLKARGLMATCMGLPEKWIYSVEGLTKICKEGRDAIMSTIAELEKYGYLERKRIRNENGTLGDCDYIFYEEPVIKVPESDCLPLEERQEDKPVLESPASEKPVLESPTSENPTLDKPTLENPKQLNKEYINNKYINNKSINDRGIAQARTYGEYENVMLTDDELARLQKEFPDNWRSKIERLSKYMHSSGKTYRNHLATIQLWAEQDKPKEAPPYRDKYTYEEGQSL